eukprot:4932483-Pleurochrysis_carterae.AAC.2
MEGRPDGGRNQLREGRKGKHTKRNERREEPEKGKRGRKGERGLGWRREHSLGLGEKTEEARERIGVGGENTVFFHRYALNDHRLRTSNLSRNCPGSIFNNPSPDETSACITSYSQHARPHSPSRPSPCTPTSPSKEPNSAVRSVASREIGESAKATSANGAWQLRTRRKAVLARGKEGREASALQTRQETRPSTRARKHIVHAKFSRTRTTRVQKRLHARKALTRTTHTLNHSTARRTHQGTADTQRVLVR